METVRNMLTCPNSKNGLRGIWSTVQVRLMEILQVGVPGRAETQESVTISIILPSAQVPPQVPHWLGNMGFTFFLLMLPNSYWVILKYASWDWSNFRGGICLPLWWEGLHVIGAFWHIHTYYPFPVSWFTPPRLSSHISCPSPNIHKLMHKQAQS
jgi:hypothetical protein